MPACFPNWRKTIVAILLVQCYYFTAFCQPGNLLPERDQSGGLESNTVRCVVLDPQNRAWVGTDNGLNILNSNSSVQKNIIAAVGNKSIWGMNFMDSLVFIGTRFDGLFVFNQFTGKPAVQFPATTITLIRKVKVFDKRVFILSNNGLYEWRQGSLDKMPFTDSIPADFPTDMFFWHSHLYALSYPGRDVIMLDNSGFNERVTGEFIPGNKHNSLLSAQSTEDKLVIGGDGFYVLKEGWGAPKMYSLPNDYQLHYVVWDIAFIGSRILLALGENNSSQKGMLYVHGDPLPDVEADAYGFLSSLAWSAVTGSLYIGDMNRGLFLQRSADRLQIIAREKKSAIIANEKHSYIYDERTARRLVPPGSGAGGNVTINGKDPIRLAKLSGDTLLVARDRAIQLYDARTGQLLNNITISQFSDGGLNSMELLNNQLYLFFNYRNGVYKVNLPDNSISLIDNIESFLPVTRKLRNRIIYLNREKGFNVIGRTGSFELNCIDKTIPFADDFEVMHDSLFVLTKNRLGIFRIDYENRQLLPLKKIDISYLVSGFIGKWLQVHHNRLYLGNDKGILQLNQRSGQPMNYYYLGNFSRLEKPVLAGNDLLISTTNTLTWIPFSNINKGYNSLNPGHTRLDYPSTVNELTAFNIDVNHPEYLLQQHGLKFLELKRNGKLISRMYSLEDDFRFPRGLDYGQYDIAFGMGNTQLRQQINASLPLNKNPFFLGAIGLFGLVTFLVLLKSRADKKQYNKKIMQNRLQVLKQNMNPHFVFNSMNLISSLILEEKYDKAVEVVAEFSNLQRTYLETNNKDAISLKEELDFLDSYLKLQHTRFLYDNDFIYEITIEPGIDPGAILLPPLILQPLAENAIKHGVIASKAPDKKIWVDVSGNNPVIISIEDNGKDISSANLGFGLGLQLVHERIQLFMYDRTIPIKLVMDRAPVHSNFGYRIEVHIG